MSARMLAWLYLFIRKRRAVKHLKATYTGYKNYFMLTHCNTEIKLGHDTGVLDLMYGYISSGWKTGIFLYCELTNHENL